MLGIFYDSHLPSSVFFPRSEEEFDCLLPCSFVGDVHLFFPAFHSFLLLCPDTTLVFMMSPLWVELERRLRKRNIETLEQN